MKKLMTAVLAMAMLAIVLVPVASANPVLTRESTGEVEFRRGNLTFPDDPDGVLVPMLDFGSHELRPGAWDLPALPSRQPAFGNLPDDMTFADDVATSFLPPLTAAVQNDRAHFIEVHDFSGDLLGWNIQVQRTQFFQGWNGLGAVPATAVNDGIPNYIQGAELRFNNFSAFAIGGGVSPTAFPTGAGTFLVPVGSNATFVSAAANQGAGVHRVQIGGRVAEADAIAAIANRELTAPVGGGAAFARNNDIRLTIPAGSPLEAATYRARLTWTLTQGPGTITANTPLPN